MLNVQIDFLNIFIILDRPECKIFVSLFRCFACFTCFAWNNETALLDSQVKQRNGETAIDEKGETVKLFRCFTQIVFILKNTEKMVLEHIFLTNLLFFSPISRKIENFRKHNNSCSRAHSISINQWLLNLIV